MKYLLDSNVFITAKNAHYGMDFVPGFWDWLESAHIADTVYSVQAVRAELMEGGDELADWVSRRPTSFFKDVDGDALARLRDLGAWATSQPQYTPAAVSTFLGSADYFLVGQASALGLTVVTHEKPAPDAKTRIRIPEACVALEVQYCLPWKMLRDEGARFVQ
jgi:hypothetical protein